MKKVSGRALFRIWTPIFYIIDIFLKIFPFGFIVFIWNWCDSLPGYCGLGIRYCLAKRLAQTVGSNVSIGRDVEIRGWKKLKIGSNVSIQRGCYLDAEGGIDIGNDVSIAHQSSLITVDHTWNDGLMPIRWNPILVSRMEAKEILPQVHLTHQNN